jgi:cytoskeletal protein RodZ
MEYTNFTSLTPEEERTFVVYERRTVETGKKAWTIGAIVGGAFFLLVMVMYLAFDAPKNKHAEAAADESSLGAEKESAPAPAAEEKKEEPAEEAPAEEAPAEEAAPAEGAEAAEAAKTEAPPPPKGATKAPPTALTK